MARIMKINIKAIETFSHHLDMVARTHTLAMRDINQILSRLALVNPEIFTYRFGWQEALASMILFRVTAPELERKALGGTLTVEDVRAFYGITLEMLNEADQTSYKHRAAILSGLWEFIITNGVQPKISRELFSKSFDIYEFYNPRSVPRTIQNDYLGKFVFLDM